MTSEPSPRLSHRGEFRLGLVAAEENQPAADQRQYRKHKQPRRGGAGRFLDPADQIGPAFVGDDYPLSSLLASAGVRMIVTPASSVIIGMKSPSPTFGSGGRRAFLAAGAEHD